MRICVWVFVICYCGFGSGCGSGGELDHDECNALWIVVEQMETNAHEHTLAEILRRTTWILYKFNKKNLFFKNRPKNKLLRSEMYQSVQSDGFVFS